MARIMVVDDEKFVRESLSRVITGENHEVILASSGEEALNLLEKGPQNPDVIILDYKMPGLDGIEVCRRIRSNNNYKNIPIVMLTAYYNEKEDAFKAGVDDFLSKPAETIDILMRLKYILRIKELSEELEKTKAYLEELKKSGKEW